MSASATPTLDPQGSARPAAVAAPSAVTVTVTMTTSEFEALQEMATERGAQIDEIIREALVEKRFFLDQRRERKKVVLQDADGKLSPIIWSYES